MTQQSANNTIRAALRQMSAGDLTEAATHFLAALGYRSDRLLDGQTGTVDYFIANFKADNTDTRSEQDFRGSVSEARILFQYTESEIAETGQRMLLEAEGFSEGNSRSFIFAAVELNGSTYPRGRYAAFTREINKRFNRVPAAVIFRTSNGKVTLAFVNRRPSKIRDDRQVLGSVSLIREIDPANPHRAHLDILAELSLPERLRWMDGHGQPHNFDGLLAAWLAALDTEELNKKFYRELFTWFERAVQTAKFPDQEKVTLTAEEHVIRLITRLMFVWFIKEKGLVAEDLFVENQVSQLLKDYDPDGGDSYYRAVLQNLFFATLNTEIGDRGFSGGGNPSHRVFSLYRYRDQMAAPQDLTALFDRSPFINGGLFDCLDSEAATGDGGYRIDCFSDVHYGKLSIPNRLFFSQDQASPGLIDLFDSYKFTVEENTPAEREVALDPELLGKVFENLLAAFNPETRENVRKQTGSYYTPRPVVDYMVDEALAATLAQKVAAQNVAAAPAAPSDQSPSFPRKPESPSDSPSFPRKPESTSDRLRSLLDYDLADADTLFTPAEKTAIVRAIAETRALDPAVGSGAFPMGILHKLTLALRRLDPGNQLWRELQREIATKRAADAFGTDDSAARERELEEISRTFDQYRDSDFGRKLYLIQNGIYGVDLQPVATQIAKLRFFISLAIEQQPNADPADNYGIRPLPNLETRFVAADTLLALGGLNRELVSPQTEDLQRQLNANRERHFHANTRALKKRYRDRDGELRHQLADSLAASGLDADHAKRVAAWDPYDQNAHADWFDPQYMFGVSDGFDVVIGNPPYVESRNSLLTDEVKDSYQAQVVSDWGESLPRGSDLLIYFYPRSVTFLSDNGVGCLITQNAWLSTDYGYRFQRFSIGRFSFQRIIDSSSKFFADTNSQNINAVITVFSKSQHDHIEYGVADADMNIVSIQAIMAKQTMKWGHLLAMPEVLSETLSRLSALAEPTVGISFGQGLNFPLKDLNQPGASSLVIVKDTHFVATSADGRIHNVPASRANKIPALIMPRGVGSRYYCTFNACKAFSFSGVELYLPSHLWESDTHYGLWAYMNSSLVWLFREVTGRRNLGGGLLKVEATDMKYLPVGFNFDFAQEVKEVFNVLQGREPLPVSEELYTEEHLLIDEIVSKHLGFADDQEAIRRALLERVSFRVNRANA